MWLRVGLVLTLVASVAMRACERFAATVGEGQCLRHAVRAALPRSDATPTLTKLRKTSSLKSRQVNKRVAAVTATASSPATEAFRSPASCFELLRQGVRAGRSQGMARVGTWNVRWFPDGVAGDTLDSNLATDVEWMACTLAWMNVDAMALAEVKSKPRSLAALEQLVSRLDALTNGKHTVHLDDCPDENGQHVAWLVNEQRVRVADWQMHAPLNPNGDACAGLLRPGLGVNLRFLGGLDLHAVAVHLKSGVEARDIELRRGSFDGLERVLQSVSSRNGDADVLVAGDFNSMGCSSCPTVMRSAAETSWLDNRLRAFRPQARRIPSELGCSEYYRQQPTLLDHVLVTSAMREAPLDTVASVYGHCRELGCEAYSGSEPLAMGHLSDHCPIVVTLLDQDLD